MGLTRLRLPGRRGSRKARVAPSGPARSFRKTLVWLALQTMPSRAATRRPTRGCSAGCWKANAGPTATLSWRTPQRRSWRPAKPPASSKAWSAPAKPSNQARRSRSSRRLWCSPSASSDRLERALPRVAGDASQWHSLREGNAPLLPDGWVSNPELFEICLEPRRVVVVLPKFRNEFLHLFFVEVDCGLVGWSD